MLESNLCILFIKSDDHKSSICKGYSLSTDDVLIYTLHLPEYSEVAKDLSRFLNPEERNRSERYYKEKDRNQFIICRAILKIVLAAHTKSDLNTIHLDYQFNKKPFLASHPELHFNISHSEDFAAIAISQSKVGIDIEYMSKNFDFIPILPDVFTDIEIKDIENATNKEYTFYSYWTRKEAFAKGLGTGIDEDFKKIPCQNGQHKVDSSLLQINENWQLYSFDLAENYIGTVAFEDSSLTSKNIAIRRLPDNWRDLMSIIAPEDT